MHTLTAKPLIQILKPDFTFSDERGTLTQLVHHGYNQVNVIFSNKNVLRGNHYHEHNTEVFYIISGCFDLTAKKDGLTETYHFKAGDMFLVPPFVLHSFFYTENTLLVSMYDKGVELADGTKDIQRQD